MLKSIKTIVLASLLPVSASEAAYWCRFDYKAESILIYGDC